MLENKKIGIGLTGSFCSLKKTLSVIKDLSKLNCDLYIFASEKILTCDTRFDKADELIAELEKISKPTSEEFGEFYTDIEAYQALSRAEYYLCMNYFYGDAQAYFNDLMSAIA